MINGTFLFSARPLDLGFQGGDPNIEFRDGQGIEILPRQCDQRIVGSSGEAFVQFHAMKVDPAGSDVNNAPTGFRPDRQG